MGTVVSDAQGMGCKVISWDSVLTELERVDLPENIIYGVPKNGMLLCAFLNKATVTHEPCAANIILDDLIDSGATRDRYEENFPNAEFHALFQRQHGDPWLTFPWEYETGPEDAIVRIIEYIGEDSSREGLLDTPKRVIKAYKELTEGYAQDPLKILARTFNEDYDEMIVVNNIPFYSLCEHHMLPFNGTVSVGYIPNKSVVGLSKIPRLVHCFARRLQIQERFTQEIATTMMSVLEPLGVGVTVTAHHTCMSMRGVKSHGNMTTNSLLGAFRDAAVKNEFLRRCN